MANQTINMICMGPEQLLHGYLFHLSHTQLLQVFMHLQCVTQYTLVCACLSVAYLCLSDAWAKTFSHSSTLPFLVKRLLLQLPSYFVVRQSELSNQ